MAQFYQFEDEGKPLAITFEGNAWFLHVVGEALYSFSYEVECKSLARHWHKMKRTQHVLDVLLALPHKEIKIK